MSKRCKRCHRSLTDPESIDRGYGNICWQKHLADKQTTLQFYLPIPKRFQGKTLLEQHKEAMRVLMRRGRFVADYEDE